MTVANATLPSFELLVHPNLHFVGLEEGVRELGCRRVVDLAQHDRHDEIAFVGNGDTFREPRLAVLHLEPIEPRAAEQVGDTHAAALLEWSELLAPQADVGPAVDPALGHNAGVAVPPDAHLGPHTDFE